ncbi:MAG: hypothetical protein ACYC27_06890 [Armatimonadota bacterium]
MYMIIRRTLILFVIAGSMLCLIGPVTAEEPAEPASDALSINDLAEQVDILQLVTDLKLKEDQITQILSTIDSLKKKYDESQKREKAMLLEIKEPLTLLRESYINGKEGSPEAQSKALVKLASIRNNRQDMQQSLVTAVELCVQMMDAGQIRIMTRTPEAISRASKMVQQIRGASDNDWQQTMTSLTHELLEIKQIDRYDDWQTRMDQIQNLPNQERDKAYEEFETQRQGEIAQMSGQVEQLLQSIRQANQQALPIAVNNLASALRPQREVRSQLFGIMNRIIDSPVSPAALKARLDAIKASSAKTPAKP